MLEAKRDVIGVHLIFWPLNQPPPLLQRPRKQGLIKGLLTIGFP